MNGNSTVGALTPMGLSASLRNNRNVNIQEAENGYVLNYYDGLQHTFICQNLDEVSQKLATIFAPQQTAYIESQYPPRNRKLRNPLYRKRTQRAKPPQKGRKIK
mgnify:CR=1 FL=1